MAWNFFVIYLGYKRIQRQRKLSPEEKAQRYKAQHLRAAERLYRTAVSIEGLLIKTCQFISSRADVAPPEYVHVLGRLQDQVPPRPYRLMREKLRQELGAYPEEVFAEFDAVPIASASLAQVHRARTKDGRDVAVKIQYPGIRRVVETDLRNFAILVKLLARMERNFDFSVLIQEAERNAPLELDFINEGKNGERVARELGHRRDIRVPEIVWEHTSRGVLTMEYIDGVKVSDTAGLAAIGVEPGLVAQIVMEAYCEQILVNGFFHADPHPGNLLVLPGPVVVFIDFGLSKELPEAFRRSYVLLTMAIFSADDAKMVEAFRALGFRTKSDDPASLVALGRSFFEIGGPEAKPYVDMDVMPEVNERLAKILENNPVVEIPQDILLIFQVMGLISGLQKRLDSQVNMFDTIVPYAEAEASLIEPASAAG